MGGKAGQAVRVFADLTEAGAEPPALLAEGAGVLAQTQGLLDELLGRDGRLGPGIGKFWHTVASCPRATLPSPLVYSVGGGSGRWQMVLVEGRAYVLGRGVPGGSGGGVRGEGVG